MPKWRVLLPLRGAAAPKAPPPENKSIHAASALLSSEKLLDLQSLFGASGVLCIHLYTYIMPARMLRCYRCAPTAQKWVQYDRTFYRAEFYKVFAKLDGLRCGMICDGLIFFYQKVAIHDRFGSFYKEEVCWKHPLSDSHARLKKPHLMPQEVFQQRAFIRLLSDDNGLIDGFDLWGFPSSQALMKASFFGIWQSKPFNEVVKTHGFGLALGIDPQKGISEMKTRIFYGAGNAMKKPGTGKGEKESAGLQNA